MSQLLETVEQETGVAPQWTVLWLHGLGADGHDFAPIVPELIAPDWPSIRFVFPHAPVRPVTLNGGVRMRAWYDLVSLDFAHRADSAGIGESIAQVEALIAREAERGIPAERLLLAGFSQGGAITLSAGVRRRQPLAGLIALSTYLPGAEQLDSAATEASKRQPIFMAHGIGDPVIPVQHARASSQALLEAGYELQWHDYPMAHQVCAEEIAELRRWMGQRFSEAG